jgi:hypothetical protein
MDSVPSVTMDLSVQFIVAVLYNGLWLVFVIQPCGLSKGPPMPYYKYEPQSVIKKSDYKLY